MPLDLTIVIPTNDAQRLRECLAAIGAGWATDVVVVDSHSTDDTATVASEYGVRLVSFQWDGHFPKKRNWFLRHHAPATKWELFLGPVRFCSKMPKLTECM